MKLDVITMESKAFYALIEEIIERVGGNAPPRFIKEKDAMEMLNISSKSHLFSLRKNLKLSYFQDPDHPKVILYDRLSIEKYLQENTQKSM